MIVIAWDVGDPCFSSGQFEELTNHAIVSFRPVNSAFHCEKINDISNQIQLLTVNLVEKIEELICFAMQ